MKAENHPIITLPDSIIASDSKLDLYMSFRHCRALVETLKEIRKQISEGSERNYKPILKYADKQAEEIERINFIYSN